MESDITITEIKAAIKTTARNKSPGLSGFSIDIYVVFWSKLKKHFHEAILYAQKNGILHESARNGLISLIPKKDRDPRYIKNWRPIILLESDYKIIAKVIANRIKLTLDKIIDKSQTGFVKGRQITENLCKLLDVITIVEEKDINGILVSIDFQKAFDKVEYSAIFATMNWFNFGPRMIAWVELLFKEFSLATCNNGYISSPFKAGKGCFQGNPISPYLFILIIEVLATKLRQNNKIKGIKIRGKTLLMTLFADDLGLLLENNKEVWEATVTMLDWFQGNTGTRINYDKTIVYRLGSARRSNARFYSHRKLIWSDNPIRILGVVLTENLEKICKLNYEEIFVKIESVMKLWQQRNLSLFGKILVTNTLIMSLFTYKFAVLPPFPEEFCTKLNDIVQKFIWRGGPKIPLPIL